PIMTLTGTEGKMFRPMAMTFSFAVLGALLLSLTYVPMMTALVMPKKIRESQSFADKFVNFLRRMYHPVLRFSLKLPYLILGLATAFLLIAFLIFRSLGAEFIPTLEEGDLAMQMAIQPGSSLSESVNTSTKAEQVLLKNFPEVKHVVSKIGTAEVPTDPMAIEDADIMIILKEKEEWVSASTREELVEKMKAKLEVIAGASFEFTQPIQLRFNELMTGAKADLAVKIFGENVEELKRLADQAANIINGIPGAADVKVEQTEGLPQLMVEYNRQKIAEYGLNIEELNTLVRTAYAGEAAGVVFENERKFDLVVRLNEQARNQLDLSRLFVHLDNGTMIPLSEVANAKYSEGPMQISRESARRRITIGVNVRNRDISSLVAEVEAALAARLKMPPGYSIQYGGQFENLQKAQARLAIAVPVALLLIFVLLYFTFGKLKYAIMIFTAVPMSAIGGVLALWMRGMPFSISAGVGFIALFGVAVLNGIVLISHFNRMRYEEGKTDIRSIVIEGSLVRMRPVIMTATVAALGFLPMAISTSNGAEVQKPLATVVIGGLITATLLTLVVLPVLYYLVNRKLSRLEAPKEAVVTIVFFLLGASVFAQQPLALDSAINYALREHPALKNADLQVQAANLGIIGSREIPKTSLAIEGGQINTTLVDYRFDASQNLGNVAVNKQRKEVAKANVALSISEKTFLERQIAFQVRQNWHDWAYQIERVRLLQQQRDLYLETSQKADLQYKAGEINRLDKTLVDNQLILISKDLSNTELERQQAWFDLRQAAFLNQDYTLPEGVFQELTMPTFSGSASSLTETYRQQTEVAKAEAILQQKQLNPEWYVGYFNQSVRPDFALQGVAVGAALPIFNKPQRARIEQAQLQEIIANNKLQLVTYNLQRQIELSMQQVTLLRQQLDTNGAALRQQAQALRELANAQLQNGEIDYFRYVQSLEMALRNELDRLDLMNKYNQAILELQFLTEE
ncbi:MAG: efflux RND transporter permease subunit, partial [Saprospiraceae bacterium]|nr:efflux RND transporter permease subunit [Saprospiraceae bacterium]